MSSMSQFFGGSGGASIKSIQRGLITVFSGSFSSTATINSVNTAKSELRYIGNGVGTGGYLTLTNSTTITATKDAVSGNATIAWELTEWN